jgi:hypothetical protein
MAHLWQLHNDRWEPAALSGPVMALTGAGELLPADAGADAPMRLQATGTDSWVLLARPLTAVRVNGSPVAAGIRALRDRDEIVAAGVRAFFSTERLVQVEAFPGGTSATFCARCRQKIEQDSPAVRCPGCGSWCHQDGDLGCWLYAATCPLCEQATALDAGFRWEPEL